MIKRRDFIRSAALLSSSLVLPKLSLATQSQNTLAIPERLDGLAGPSGLRYPLTLREGSMQFLPGKRTSTFGISRDYLGPTLFLRRGDNVEMAVENTLNEQTTLHWHGLHVPAAADGGPAQIIDPGSTWRPSFEVQQRAGTFWYHSHLLHKTGEQVYRGLAGMIVIEDDESKKLALPQNYGVDDIPLLVQDRRFNDDGSLSYLQSHRDVMMGMYGDTILVNGCLNPVFRPTTRRLRMRLLNAANARTFTFAFDDQRDFALIASDGGFLEAPYQCKSVVLAPSERAEIIVEIVDQRPFKLISLPLDSNSPFAMRGMMGRMHSGNESRFDILKIEPQLTLEDSPDIPAALSQIPRMDPNDAVITRRLELTMAMGMGMMRRRQGSNASFFINGQAMNMNRIDYRVKKDTTEIWEVVNDTMMMHPFHIHHSQFQILDRNGVAPAAEERGLKDTVKIGPGETVRFIMRFENFSDTEIPYMYHCHILEHEDNGMMGQFTVE